MTNWVLSFATALLIFVSNDNLLAITKGEQEAILMDYGNSAPTYAADALNSEQKQWFLKYILDQKSTVPTWSSDAFDTQLLQLGHEPTIQKYRKGIEQGFPKEHEVNYSHQARLIEYFEKQLFINEPVIPPGGGDTPPQSWSIGAASWILKLTASSREIPGETRVWAQHLHKLLVKNITMMPSQKEFRANEEIRLIVRKWFKDNIGALRARDFAKVSPGEEHSLLTASSENQNPTESRQSASPKDIQPPLSPSDIAKQTPANPWPLILVGVLFLLLAMGIFVGQKRR